MADSTRVRLWLIRSTPDAAVSALQMGAQRRELPSAGAVIYPPGGTLGPLVQPCHQLVLLDSGDLELDVDGRTAQVRPGEVALLRPGQRVHFRFAPAVPSQHSWLSLPNPPLLPQELATLRAAPQKLPVSPAMTHLIQAASVLGTRLTVPYTMLGVLIATALTLFVEEARAQGLMEGNAKGHPATAAARRYVREHLDHRITLRDLAAAAHVTRPYLVHVFRREVGTTPMRYVWAERVRQGVYLLEQTGLPVAEVAARAGFQTSHHFARAVRLATGASPTQVRQRAWNAAAG